MLDLDDNDLCPCCNLPIFKKDYTLSTDPEDFSNMGTGFCSFFYFTKYSIFLLIAIFIVSGAYNFFCTLDNCKLNEDDCSFIAGVPFSSKDTVDQYNT